MPQRVRKTFYKEATVTDEVEVKLDEEDIKEIIEEYGPIFGGAVKAADGLAGEMLDTLIDRGAVMHLTPSMRYELLTGSRQLQSVLV